MAVGVTAAVPALLRAGQEMPHRVEIQPRRPRVLGQAPRAPGEQARFAGRRSVDQFVAAGGFVVGEFQPVERARRGQGHPAEGGVAALQAQRSKLGAGRSQTRIAAQEGVVLAVFGAQGQTIESRGANRCDTA